MNEFWSLFIQDRKSFMRAVRLTHNFKCFSFFNIYITVTTTII